MMWSRPVLDPCLRLVSQYQIPNRRLRPSYRYLQVRRLPLLSPPVLYAVRLSLDNTYLVTLVNH